jgi:serine/threonine protein kinase
MGCANSAPIVDKAADFHCNYALGAKIGMGQFAQVHMATTSFARSLCHGNVGPRQAVAVKIFETDKEAARKEERVWKIVGAHPNCVRLHEVYYDSRFCYMVMEKCHARLLQALGSLPTLTEQSLPSFFSQMLAGISHCHSAGVVHRDIKPDNFMLTDAAGSEQPVVKLIDFGMSTCMPKNGRLIGARGTPPYMCPEIFTGHGADTKADVWSFGVIVYLLLFGEFPYMPKEHSTHAMRDCIIKGNVLPSFEPVQQVSAPKDRMRSHGAVSFAKALLAREPQNRHTAEQSLHMPWMCAATESEDIIAEDLPSLHLVLESAKRHAAFEAPEKVFLDSGADICLNKLQKAHRGQSMLATSQAEPPTEGMLLGEQASSLTLPLSPKTSEQSTRSRGLSNFSTNCDSASNWSDGTDLSNSNQMWDTSSI